MKILIVTGSSGGHVFPALSFIDALKEKCEQIDTLLVLPKQGITAQAKDFNCPVEYISISSVKAIFGLVKGCWESINIFFKFCPDIVVGFGTVVSIPLIIFSKARGVKTLIHEQNVIPGRANKFLAGFSDKIAVSFGKSQDYFPKRYRKKIVFTGNLLRKNLVKIDKREALKFFAFSPDKITLLVMGGSKGAHKINFELLKAIPLIQEKSKMQIVHLTGEKDYDSILEGYKNYNNIDIRVYKFLTTMQYAYSAADLVLCRAGATSIAEIAYFGLPAIIIPYPYAYKHQLSNAKALEGIGSAKVIIDNQLNAEILKETLCRIINDPSKLESMRSCYQGITNTKARQVFINEVLSLK